MKLVQKILSHGLFIAVIVVAFLVYTKRADLFPQWFGASHTSAARATGDKLAAAKPDTGVLPPAHTVTRPLPEKTLIKKEVVPPVSVPEKVNPTGTETAPLEQQQPAGGDTAAPAPSEPAEQPPADIAPAEAGAAGGGAGSETASEQTASGDTSAPPIFRPLDEAQQARQQAAPTDAPAPAKFRPLDDEQQAEKPAASTDVSAPSEAVQAAAQNPGPVAAEPQQQAAQEQAAQEQAAQEQAAQEQAAQEQAAQEQAAQEQAAQEQAAQEQAPQEQAPQEQAPQEQAEAAQTQVATATPSTSVEPAAVSGAAPESEPQTNAKDAQLQQQLERAREFYWHRDLRGAMSAYQSLGNAYPDNAEVWGEIGNFYYSLRRSEQAGAAYAHAVELLMQNNQPARARQLLGVLFRLDARKARELETRLQQTGG